MVGKVPPDDLAAHVFARTGAADERVLQGPGYGEDAAAIDLGERTLVVSTDPISLAAERVGTLGVPVACNDVAASGADPAWLTVDVFVPEDDPAVLEAVAEQLHVAALSAGVSIVGGHSEYDPGRSRPLLSLTTVERAAEFFDGISVAPEARVLREHATAMHDPTEGGLVDGLLELASASNAVVAVERESVPVRPETRVLCDAMGVDPLRVFGSGALVATVPPEAVDAALDALADAGVEAADLGEVRAGKPPALELDGEWVEEPVRDDLYALWESE
jgi:hydrogenase expression/formation protein HypE